TTVKNRPPRRQVRVLNIHRHSLPIHHHRVGERRVAAKSLRCYSGASTGLVDTADPESCVAVDSGCCLSSSSTESTGTFEGRGRVAAKSSRCYSGASIALMGTTEAESRVAAISKCCLSSSSSELVGTS
ncbi:hypothetical protein PF004_g32473, partial [Phytophthora fragariae]